MRDYLFRGKRHDNGEWVEGLPCYGGGLFPDTIETMAAETFSVIPETVGERSDVPDYDGIEIFEGDILESRASENKEDWKRWIVTFHDGSFCFEREIPRKRKYKHEQNLLCADEVKLYGLVVIGNVHDNPELLEDKQ